MTLADPPYIPPERGVAADTTSVGFKAGQSFQVPLNMATANVLTLSPEEDQTNRAMGLIMTAK